MSDRDDQSPLEPSLHKSVDDNDQSLTTDHMDIPDPDAVSETHDPEKAGEDNSEDQSPSLNSSDSEDLSPEDYQSSQNSTSSRKGTRRHLGRGLSALLGDDEQNYADLDKLRSSKTVPVEFLLPGRFQPRRNFDKSEIQSLSHSIKARGILQPILARRHPEKVNNYEIIAGERRWRAAQMAGLHEVPVLVRDLDDGIALEIALVENLQRQNLNAIEEAAGYRRLMDEFSHTQQALSKTIGRSRSHIANTLRLLKLPEKVQAMIESGVLTAGHARAIATASKPQKLAQKIVDNNLSVRQAELLAQKNRGRHHNKQKQGLKSSNQRSGKDKSTDTMALENEVSEVLGLRVSIDHRVDGSGLVAVNYSSLEQLEMLLARLSCPVSHDDEGIGMEESADPEEMTTVSE